MNVGNSEIKNHTQVHCGIDWTMDRHYKDYHIKLMHSNGTTAFETMLVILPSSLYTFITAILVSLLIAHVSKHLKCQFSLEFLVLILSIVLNLTVLANYLKNMLIALFVIAINLSLLVHNIKGSKTKFKCDSFRTNYITNARSTINILSVLAILAVDFNIFPRCFAKTETFGYSLMDTGVGLFMYSNGIVAPEARGKRDSIKKCIKSSLPILILGVARLVFVKQTDYNVPVSEYGVHWNFFITLGFTKIFTSFILNVIKLEYIFINAICIMVAHEVLLQAGLQRFVLINSKRDNFLVANKEGLVSFLGYICIYLFSVYFGYLLNIKNDKQNKVTTGLKFVSGSLLALAMSIVFQNYFGVSRRLANSAYCFWVLFIGIFMTGLFYLGQTVQEYIFRDKLPNSVYSPLIFEAVNYNGLLFFLIGNILTGLINMAFNTLTINGSVSLIILVMYMFINCFVVTVLYCKQIKLKL